MPCHQPRVDVDLIKEMLHAGATNREIAAAAGCTERQVIRYKASEKLTVHVSEYAHRPISQERLDQAAELINEGWSHQDIVRRLHISDQCLKRYFPGTAWGPAQQAEYLRMLRALDRLPDKLYDIQRQRAQFAIAA